MFFNLGKDTDKKAYSFRLKAKGKRLGVLLPKNYFKKKCHTKTPETSGKSHVHAVIFKA